VVALDKDSQLVFATTLSDIFYDYWAYPVTLLPFIAMLIFWIKRGRDERFVGDNIYYKPQKATTQTTPVLFKREFLPLVYSPINGLTPSEVGTLLDERVDVKDVVAEIIELGRLGFLKIEKIDKKLAKDDFKLTQLNKDTKILTSYQKYLLESIFSFGKEDKEVLLSELKQKFYTKLNSFKEKLYTHMTELKYFPARPDNVRVIWLIIASFALSIIFAADIAFTQSTGDFKPFFLLIASIAPTLVFAYQMPKKTAAGYSLYRQAKGLQFYLGKGKWREEINEKHLFLEEMLPLAISLGVVKQLANDMQELGVEPPSYFNAHSAVWVSSFNNFSSIASSSVIAGASSSGGWSGGSGFSGGGGGGFGGGGGGSW
jgi:uncharacterized membrane protein